MRNLRPREVISPELERGRVIIYTWPQTPSKFHVFPLACSPSTETRDGCTSKCLWASSSVHAKRHLREVDFEVPFHPHILFLNNFAHILEWWLDTIFNAMLHSFWHMKCCILSGINFTQSLEQSTTKQRNVMGSDDRRIQKAIIRTAFPQACAFPHWTGKKCWWNWNIACSVWKGVSEVVHLLKHLYHCTYSPSNFYLICTALDTQISFSSRWNSIHSKSLK